MRAIILTAGNGTRIRAISHCRSKCMLPVQGRPLLAWHLDRCVDSGQVDAIHMVIHPQETQIQRYFGASYRGVPLSYHVQTDLSTGLVGAIFSVDCPQVMEEPVLLLLGDEYLPKLALASLLETAQRRPQALLAVVVPTEEPQKIRQNYTVALDKDHLITQAVEKPQTPLSPYIGTGVVYFPRGLLPTFAQCCRSFADAQLVDLILYAHQAYAYPAKTSYWNLNCRETYREMSRNEGETLPYATMTEAFQAVARQHGTTLAVVSGTQQITYAQLAEQSDRFCQRLQALGCQPGHCVALLCGRTVEHLTAVLGIWKAGCHYLPLDEHLPEVRLAYMVEQAQAVAVIAREGLTETTPHFACPILSYADLLAGHAIPLPDLPPVQEHCRQYAYLCFTSGSTGQPKGAIVWQRSLLNLTAQMQKEAFGLLPSGRLQVGVTASFAFDLSVQQIFPALLGGHTLHIIPHETKLRPLALAQALDGLDVCDGTPLMMELLNQALAAHPEQPFRLKLYLSGGEELKKPILHAFFQRCPNCLVVNCYGPTECTVETTLFPVDAQREGQYDVLPIGRPMKNTRVYLLDEERKFLCPGETGDIWIAGSGVGGGYVNQPELTAQAFCPDLLEPESTMYRTGDRGRWGRDGNLYYAGRQDNQVKFKGYRIELGEIEKNVESVPGVALCKALLTETGGRKKLVAYYTAQAGQSPTQEALYAELLECLPEYMIPQQLIPTEQFQLNHNGKLDKQALVETAPQDPLTAQVLACVGEVCELPLQADRSLITQGVDSLSLLSLLAELEERFSVKLDFAQWNVRMTAQDIAEQVQTAKNRKPERKGSAVRAKGVPALPLQAYLTQVEQMNRRAAELGMEDTHFVNCTGLTAEGHVTSAHDIALMSRELILHHPDIRRFTTIWMDTLRGGSFQLSNTNKLIRFYDGATGLKTGSTDAAGFCISATAERDGMELIAVIMKGQTADKRNTDAKTLLNYGFSTYALADIAPQEPLAPVPVRLGAEDAVQPVLPSGSTLLVEKTKAGQLTQSVELPAEVEAPVAAGQALGTLTVRAGDEVLLELPLQAEQAVEKLSWGGMLTRLLRCAFLAG